MARTQQAKTSDLEAAFAGARNLCADRRAERDATVRQAAEAVNLIVYGGPDRLAELRAREDGHRLEREALEAERRLEEAESAYAIAAIALAEARAPGHRAKFDVKLRELRDLFQRIVDVYGEAQAIVFEAHDSCFIQGKLRGNPCNTGFLQMPARVRGEFENWRRGADKWLEEDR